MPSYDQPADPSLVRHLSFSDITLSLDRSRASLACHYELVWGVTHQSPEHSTITQAL